jgi:hypothetical protein
MTGVNEFASALMTDKSVTRSPNSRDRGLAATDHLLYTVRTHGTQVLAALRAYRSQHPDGCRCRGCELYEADA